MVLAVPTAIARFTPFAPPILPPTTESFEPALATLDSVDEILAFLAMTYPSATPLEKLDAADALLRKRFVHGYSLFRFEHDWVAASLRFLWDDLASPVRPDDILRFRRAACSQQAIVLQEIARRLGFSFAKAGAPGHFLAAVKIEGQWWVFDPNREIKLRRYPFDWLKQADPRMAASYDPVLAVKMIDWARKDQITFDYVDRNPAPQASLLHGFTSLVSRFGWLFFLTLWAGLRIWQSRAHRAGRQAVATLGYPGLR